MLYEIMITLDTFGYFKLYLFRADTIKVLILVEVFDALFELIDHKVILILLVHA